MDRRDRNLRWWDEFDQRTMTAIIDNGEESVEIKCEYQVCGTCDGKGTHVNPGVDAHGISSDEFAEDPGFAEDYFSGVYDQQCNECDGNRVVPWPVDPKHVKMVEELLRDRAAYEAECAAERRMGA